MFSKKEVSLLLVNNSNLVWSDEYKLKEVKQYKNVNHKISIAQRIYVFTHRYAFNMKVWKIVTTFSIQK